MIKAYRQQEASLSGAQGSSDRQVSRSILSEAEPFFNRWRLGFLGILVVSILAYVPSLMGLKIWDDDRLLDGSGIGGGTSVVSALTHPFLGAYFRPLVSLSFYFENKWWTGTPFYYHQTNILLHMLACAALMGFVLTAFGSRRLALLSGLIFAIQPAQVGAVAWIGGRTDSLCALLVTLFAYTLLLGVRSMGAKRAAWIAVSTVAFFLAAVTKEQVVALLPLVPFALKAFGSERPKARAYVWVIAPFAVATTIFIALWVVYNVSPLKALHQSPLGQMATAGHTAVYYTLLFLLPSGRWMHTLSLGTLQAVGWPSAFAGLVLLCAYIAGLVRLAKLDPRLGWIGAFVALSLLPVANLVPLPSLLVAPYRAGVAGVGVAVLLGWAGLKMARHSWTAAIGIAFVAWCAWLTVWGAAQWKDPITLFSMITREDPYSIVARRNMSSYLLRVGRPQQSILQMKNMLGMLYGSNSWQDPQSAYAAFVTDKNLQRKVQENQGNDVRPEQWVSELFSQLGYAEGRTHQFVASKKAFETAVKIDPSNARPRIGLAQFALYEKKRDVALRNLTIAAAEQPGDAQIRNMIANIYLLDGRLNLAEEQLQVSIKLQPWFGPTYQDLADVQVKRGEVRQAIATLQSALNCTVLDANAINNQIAELQQLQLKGAKHAL